MIVTRQVFCYFVLLLVKEKETNVQFTNVSSEKMTALTKGIHSSLLPLRSGGWIMSGMAVNIGKMALLLAG